MLVRILTFRENTNRGIRLMAYTLVKYLKNLPSGNNLIAWLASCKSTFHKREYEQ